MKTKLLGLIAACALLGSTVAANASPYIVTLEEVGSNVVATGNGAIDLTGLALNASGNAPPQIFPATGSIYTGAPTSGTDTSQFVSSVFVGPSNFGPGASLLASAGSGPLVGVVGSLFSLVVPTAYSSNTALTDTAIYDGQTFASLDVSPGTYVWTWGSGADQSFTLEIGVVTTPLPAALPLFASSLGALGLLGWRRKRKAAAIAA